MKDEKLNKSLDRLKSSLKERNREGASPINDAGVAKCFEVALEYAWKAIKRVVEDQGLEASSPKEAVKVGAVIGLIDDPELWIQFINDRNLSVHDYIGIDNEEYLKSISKFVTESEVLVKKILKLDR